MTVSLQVETDAAQTRLDETAVASATFDAAPFESSRCGRSAARQRRRVARNPTVGPGRLGGRRLLTAMPMQVQRQAPAKPAGRPVPAAIAAAPAKVAKHDVPFIGALPGTAEADARKPADARPAAKPAAAKPAAPADGRRRLPMPAEMPGLKQARRLKAASPGGARAVSVAASTGAATACWPGRRQPPGGARRHPGSRATSRAGAGAGTAAGAVGAGGRAAVARGGRRPISILPLAVRLRTSAGPFPDRVADWNSVSRVTHAGRIVRGNLWLSSNECG